MGVWEGVRGVRPRTGCGVRGVAVCVEEDESDIAGEGVREGVEEPDVEGEGTVGSSIWEFAAVADSARSWRRERTNCCSTDIS